MERQRFGELMGQLQRAAQGHRDDPRCTHRDRVVVAVLLWATLHDKPVSWATQPRHWPGDLRPRAGLPSQSCMSRRLRSAGVLALIQRFEQVARAPLPRGDLKLIDGRPLPTGGCSKDPDAATGYGGGQLQRGYKLHLLCDRRGAVEHWHLTAMNGSEPDAAARILGHATDTAYVLGDGNYDVNRLYEQAAQRGIHWIALPHHRAGQAPGHRRHSPRRLAWWSYVRSPHGGRTLRRLRNAIERVNAWQGHATIGLHHLPHHVRRLHRVRLWVALKLILYHHWLAQRLAHDQVA
jgi:hypothetical protein